MPFPVNLIVLCVAVLTVLRVGDGMNCTLGGWQHSLYSI